MGWSRGSELAEKIWMAVGQHIPPDKTERVAKRIIALFEDMDCDTIDEARALCEAAGLDPQ